MILTALMFSALFGMAAIAVDLGAAYTERRHDQNTADAAVMSGAVEAVIGGGVIDDVVEEVSDKVDITLGRTVTDQEWIDCVDPDPLHYTTNDLAAANPDVDPATDCISFNASFDRIRVRLPEQGTISVFGDVMGFDPITTTASAEAAVVDGAGTGAPPFVALSTATQGDFICLRTSSAGEPQNLLKGMGPNVAPAVSGRADPCDATVYPTASENFGTLQPYRYTDGCAQQNYDTEIAISLGIDHIMGFFPDGYNGTLGQANIGDRIDGGANCQVAFPNTFQVDTGLNASGLRCALISLKNEDLCNEEVPRLHQGSYVDNNIFAAENADNAAPWAFLRPAADLFDDYAPDECVILASTRVSDPFDPYTDGGYTDIAFPTQYDSVGVPTAHTTYSLNGVTDAAWDHYDQYDLFIECLETWDPTDPELFTADVGTTPRFAFIPKVAEATLDGAYVHIESFAPSYMYRMYQKVPEETPDSNCDPLDANVRASVGFYTHDAGQDIVNGNGDPVTCGTSTGKVDRLSSIMFACGMVPDTLCNKDTGHPDFTGQDIYEFRLVR